MLNMQKYDRQQLSFKIHWFFTCLRGKKLALKRKSIARKTTTLSQKWFEKLEQTIYVLV